MAQVRQTGQKLLKTVEIVKKWSKIEKVNSSGVQLIYECPQEKKVAKVFRFFSPSRQRFMTLKQA